MTIAHSLQAVGGASSRNSPTRWVTFVVMLVVVAIVLVPLGSIAWLSLRPPASAGGGSGPSLGSFAYIFQHTEVFTWLRNSLVVTLASTFVTVVISAPAGYVISRARSRWVSGYSLFLFTLQSFPIVLFVIPLFVLFARMQLADTLRGVLIVYVATSLAIACWMFAAYFDSIPRSLEEAAWLDGCSLFSGFVRVVLRNSLPGILSTAIFGFLVAWNDYLVALVFLRSEGTFTLPVGLQFFFQQNFTDWGPVMAMSVIMLLPPVLIFSLLNRFFSVGGIGGSLAGQ